MRKCQNYKRKAAKKVPKQEKVRKVVNDISMDQQFKPRTENQRNYVISIAENTVTLCHGPAGTGKTCVAVGMACEYLSNGKVDKIIVTRPMVQCGRRGGGLGYLKGDLSEKFLPFMSPVIEEIEYFLGVEETRRLILNKTIQIIPLELMKGKNFERTFMICDEAENCEFEQLKMFLSRICDGTKCVVSGDIAQVDIDKCHYAWFIDRLDDLDGVGIIELGIEDIQRHGIVGRILGRVESFNESY